MNLGGSFLIVWFIKGGQEAIEFYSNGRTIYTPQGTYQEIIEYAKKNKVNYIVAWNRELSLEKEIKSLTGPSANFTELTQELSLGTPEGDIIIYSTIFAP